MADKKISALTAATTPLGGTEVLPIVQSGTTVNVSIANITAGRSISASGLTLSGGTANTIPYLNASNVVTTGTALQFDGVNIGLGLSPSASVLRSIESSFGVFIGRDASNIVHNAYYASGGWTYIGSTFASQALQDNGEHIWNTAVSGTAGNLISFNERMKLTEPGNLTLNSGNFIIGTAGKGIDFSANSHAAGMTSELLNWYEVGTWTGTLTSTTPPTLPVTKTGRYTRIGNQVTIAIEFDNVSTIGASGSMEVTGLPFTAVSAGYGPVMKSGIGTQTVTAGVYGGLSKVIFSDSGTMNNTPIVAAVGVYLRFSATYFM